MIFSRKYGQTFRNRSEIARHQWRDRQTKPVLPWFGLRDAPYSDQYRKEHGLPTRAERRQGLRLAGQIMWLVAGAVWLLVLMSMCGKG